ncbi:exodeoxyribonuclease VII small subunit [Terrilactibacillus sp. S3-3]|nr:exodeoxyribonuclease VII small subunit [Terrilactibacillus sp. S3-3]
MVEKNEGASKEILTFEDAMAKLELIVKQLEENNVPLEKAIDLFQEGMDLSKYCHDKLQKVEEKMDRLIDKEGHNRPFSIQEDETE